MTASHTPGRLYVVESDEHWGRVNCHITAKHDDAMLGSIWCGTTSQNREDARRLVACWNACQNVETDVLEQHALGVIGAEASLVKHQRDELLEALKFVMTAHGEQLDWAFEQAQDAIAKAEGKHERT